MAGRRAIVEGCAGFGPRQSSRLSLREFETKLWFLMLALAARWGRAAGEGGSASRSGVGALEWLQSWGAEGARQAVRADGLRRGTGAQIKDTYD